MNKKDYNKIFFDLTHEINAVTKCTSIYEIINNKYYNILIILDYHSNYESY